MIIRVEHTNNPLNYGTNMMVANLIYYLGLEADNEFVIDVYNDEDLYRYKEQYPKLNIKRKTIDYNFFYNTNIFGKIFNKIKRDYFYEFFNSFNLKKLERGCDVLIILGGDDLSEYYGQEQLIRELKKLNYIKRKKKVYLIGQTIGPFSKRIMPIAKEALKDVIIYTRDPWTKKYLEDNLNLDNIKLASDLAFKELPNQKECEIEKNILNRYNLIKDNYITIVPSGLYESYCKEKECYVEELSKIIKYTITKYPDKKIVILPHVLRPSIIDDRNIIRELENLLEHDKKITYIYDVMSPLEARFILGNGYFSISGRMHGTINTLSMKKPSISISYSVKYEGVIAQGMGLPELIVEGSNERDWKNGNISTNTIEKINYVDENYKYLSKKIEDSINNNCNELDKMFIDINKSIRKS